MFASSDAQSSGLGFGLPASQTLNSTALWGWLQGSEGTRAQPLAPQPPAPQPLSAPLPASSGPRHHDGGELSFGPLPPTPAATQPSTAKSFPFETFDSESRGSPTSEIPTGPSLNTGHSTPLQCSGGASSLPSAATSYRSGASTPQPHSPMHMYEVWGAGAEGLRAFGSDESPPYRRGSAMSSGSSTPSTAALAESHAQTIRSHWRWIATRAALSAYGTRGAQRLTAYFGQKSAILLDAPVKGEDPEAEPLSPLAPQHQVSTLSPEEQTLVAEKLSRHALRIAARILRIVEESYSESHKHQLPLHIAAQPPSVTDNPGPQPGHVAEWLSRNQEESTGRMPRLMTQPLALTSQIPEISPSPSAPPSDSRPGSFSWPVTLQLPQSSEGDSGGLEPGPLGFATPDPSGPWVSTPGTPSPHEAPPPASWSSIHEVLGPLHLKLANKMASLKAKCSASQFLQAVSPHIDSVSNALGVGAIQDPEGLRGATYRSTVITPAGHSYEGTFKDGNMHGYGRLVWPDGHWFQGEFEMGETCGLGVRVWQSGHNFVGQDVAGRKEGLGVMVWPDGRRYEGSFKSDVKDGLGLMLWPNRRTRSTDGSETARSQGSEGAGSTRSSDSTGVLKRWYFGFWSRGLQHGHGLEVFDNSVYLVTYHLGKLQQKEELDPQPLGAGALNPSPCACFQALTPNDFPKSANPPESEEPRNPSTPRGQAPNLSSASGRRRGQQRLNPRHIHIESKATDPPLVVGAVPLTHNSSADHEDDEEGVGMTAKEVMEVKEIAQSSTINGAEGSWVFKVVNGEIVARPQHLSSPPKCETGAPVTAGALETKGARTPGAPAAKGQRVDELRAGGLKAEGSMESPASDCQGDLMSEEGETEPEDPQTQESMKERDVPPGVEHMESSDSLNSSWDSSEAGSEDKTPMRTSDRIIEIMQGGSVDRMVDKDLSPENSAFGLAEQMYEESEREVLSRLSLGSASSKPSEDADAQFPSSSSGAEDSDVEEDNDDNEDAEEFFF